MEVVEKGLFVSKKKNEKEFVFDVCAKERRMKEITYYGVRLGLGDVSKYK